MPTTSSWKSTASVVAVVGALTVTGCTSLPDAQTHAGALWVGTTASGEEVAGVSDVTVAVEPTTLGGGVEVDDDGTLTGPTWRKTSVVSAAMGVLGSGMEIPDGVTVFYRGGQNLDGPSAGGLLTSAVIGALRSTPLDSTVTMTGTIAPSTAIGPVAGIPAKIRAAAEDGYRTVLIPQQQQLFTDATNDEPIDTISYGADLGIEVIPVATVREAYALLTGQQPNTAATATSVTGPMNASVTTYLTTRTDDALDLMDTALTTSNPNNVFPDTLIADANTVRTHARTHPDATLVLPALSVAREATVLTATSGAPPTAAELTSDVATALNECALLRNKPMNITYLEQATAFTATTSHASSICTTMTLIDQWLSDGTTNFSPDLLNAAHVETHNALFMLTHTIPLGWQIAARTGTTPLTPDATDALQRYTTLLANAADANRAYTNALAGNDIRQEPWFTRRAEQPNPPTTPTTKPRTTEDITWALATQTANFTTTGMTVSDAYTFAIHPDLTTNQTPERGTVTNRALFTQHAYAALSQIQHTVNVMTTHNHDPSFFVWLGNNALFMATDMTDPIIERDGLYALLDTAVNATITANSP